MIGRKSLEVRNTEDKNTHCQITVLLKTSNGSSLPTEYKQYILKLILKTLHFMTFSSFPIQPLVCTHEPSALTITDYYFPTTTFIFLLLECPPHLIFTQQSPIYSGLPNCNTASLFYFPQSSSSHPIQKNFVYSSVIALIL